MSADLTRGGIVPAAPFVRTEYRISMRCDTLDAVVFLLITFTAVNAAPVTDFRLGQNERDFATHRFYGPWSIARKRNGDYVDYADYGADVPGFYGISIDQPIGIAGHSDPEDFLSRHDMGLAKLLADYGPSPLGLAVFRVGVHPDYWLSKNEKRVAERVGNDLLGDQQETEPTELSTININN